VDYATGWLELVPLKTLTSKELCDALLKIWTRTGIPKVMVSDNATNYKAELMQELYKRFGVEIRYSTPGHPEANGRCERMVQVVKRMLHHLVKNTEQPAEWAQRLPLLEFCVREAPSASRGASAFELVYSRPARGPLAVLKDSWSGEKLSADPLMRSTEDYLDDLRKRLTEVQEIVEDNLLKAQDQMETQYNQGKRLKKFEVDDLVLYMMPTSTNRLLST